MQLRRRKKDQLGLFTNCVYNSLHFFQNYCKPLHFYELVLFQTTLYINKMVVLSLLLLYFDLSYLKFEKLEDLVKHHTDLFLSLSTF